MSDEEDYRLQHRAPSGPDDVAAPMHDIESVLPNVHEHPEYYRYGSPGEDESIRHIHRVRDRPEAKVRIYRALPAEHVHKGFQTGDWVSPSKEYARQHGRQGSETGHDDWPVISATVPAKHLWNEGYPTEFGYGGPSTEAARVAFKGGKNQEVRQHADGVVRKVVRRESPIKDYSFTSEDHRDYDERMSGAAPHGVVHAWAPHGQSAGHIKFGPEGHEVHIEPEHQHVADELVRRMRRRMPKESSVQRVAVLQGFAHLPDEQPDAFARRTASSGPKITVVAHVSGNSIDVLHCAFCGSGALCARSDGTIECTFCFSGETEYLTWDGVRTLRETVGTTQRVLVSERNIVQIGKGRARTGNPKLSDEIVVEIRNAYADGVLKADLARQFGVSQGAIKKIVERRTWQHVGGGGHAAGARATQEAIYGDGHGTYGGRWVDAEIRSFGVQPLLKVTLQRQGVEKIVHATGEHRWFVHPHHGSSYRFDHKLTVHTHALQPGDRLASLFARPRLRQNGETVPSPFGIAHGFTFGDGSLTGRGGARVTAWGEKDKSLLPYFAASRQVPVVNGNGTTGIEILDLPAFFKDIPSRTESISYLYGWLAGYFAADGTVGKTGTAQLDCVDQGILQWVRDLCTQLGIGTYGIRPLERIGLGQTEPHLMWRMSFVMSTLTPDFFIHPEHRTRIENRSDREDSVGWTVVAVEETDRVEEVYCAVVAGHENFTLADNINVLNCTAVFTVQVQPQFAAFPQTAEGTPYQWPGQPGPEQLAGGGSGAMGGFPGPVAGEQDPEAEGGDGNPFADDTDESDTGPDDATDDDADDDGGKAQVGGKDAPPFSKKKSSSLYRTAAGHLLDETRYLQHLAISHAHNRGVVARAIRAAQ